MEYETAIIDCDSLIFSAFHPNKVLDENNNPIKEDGKFVYYDKTEEEIVDSVDFLMDKIINETNCTGYIAFVKGKGNYRYNINSEYKANRPKESPKFWSFTKSYLIRHWNAIEVNGIEVDDAVNITRLKIPNSFICAIDKDLLSLEGTHFNWRKSEWRITDKEQAEYKFWSDMIIGQSGDNIKGIPKKGEAYAKFRLQESFDLQFDIDYNEYCRNRVFNDYINHFGEEKGIEEFYKNYKSLKILSEFEGFEIPNINLINKDVGGFRQGEQ